MTKFDMLVRVLSASKEAKHYTKVKLALSLNYGWDATLTDIHSETVKRPDVFSTSNEFIWLRDINSKPVYDKSAKARAQEKSDRIRKYKEEQKKKFKEEVKNGNTTRV